MPRKKSSVPLGIRVREAQRRSRIRRQELIEDLQKKLHEYEKHGVESAIAMQKTARHVAWQNSQLRILLAMKGISNQEVDDFLHNSSIQYATNSTSSADRKAQANYDLKAQSDSDRNIRFFSAEHHTCRSRELDAGFNTSVDRHEESQVRQLVVLPTSQPTFPTLHVPRSLLDKPEPSYSPLYTEGITSCSATPSESDYKDPRFSVTFNNFEQTSRHNGFPATTSNLDGSQAESPMLEMSCETAANIIISMLGHVDKELIRSELGCDDSRQCIVKNTIVFQVMDMH